MLPDATKTKQFPEEQNLLLQWQHFPTK